MTTRCWWSAVWLVGCGGAVTTPDAVILGDAGSAELSDAPAVSSDGGESRDAPAACLTEVPATGDDCKVDFKPCGGCTTGREYFCKTGSPSTYGRVPMRCDRLEDVGGGPHYCCEAACVRHSSTDATCAHLTGTRAYDCPNDGFNRSLVGPPAESCTLVTPDVSATHPRIYCCK